jgi:hypothetical protein
MIPHQILYLDNIVLDRVYNIHWCDIYLSKSPGFKLDRIHDNKNLGLVIRKR